MRRRFQAKPLAIAAPVADTTAPTVPTNVTASGITSASFGLAWAPSTDAVGVTGYDVQIDGTSYATPTTTSVTVTGRAASTAYSVRVRARDAAGNWSALSTAITATTSAAAQTTVTYTVTTAAGYQSQVQTYLNTIAARSDTTTPAVLQFAPGTYTLTDQWTISGLQNVTITSQDTANPATIQKAAGAAWNGEYLLRMYYSANVRVAYLNFTGNTAVYDPNDSSVHWADQGVWFASSHDTRIDHCSFANIGNAATRHNTKLDDAPGVHSYNHVVEDCTFTNSWQVTTTQEGDTAHGGSYNWTVQRCTFVNAHGSVKFASRSAGGHTAKILNNTWTGTSTAAPLELSSVDDVEIRGNNFGSNTTQMILNAYTNNVSGVAGFTWANNITIADNTSAGSDDGWRLSLDAYADGYQPQGSGFVFDNNTVTGVRNTDSNVGVVRIANGGITGVTFTNNHFASLANNRPYVFDARCTGIVKSGNTLNGAALP